MPTPTPGSFTAGESTVQYAVSEGNFVPALVLGLDAATPPVLSLFVYVAGVPGFQKDLVTYDANGVAGTYKYDVAESTPGDFTVGGDLTVDGDAAVTGALAVTGAATASNLSGTNTGDVTLSAFGSSPDAKGATLTGQALALQPADGTHPGLVTTAAQTLAGAKTFSGDITASSYGLNATVGSSFGFTWTSAGGGHLIAHAQAGNFDWSDGSVNQFLLTATSATFAGYVNAVGSYKISGTSVLSGSGTNTIVTSTGGTTVGNVYLSNQAEHFAVASDAGVEVLSNVGASFILRSPDGTRWKLAVANTTGALTAVLA